MKVWWLTWDCEYEGLSTEHYHDESDAVETALSLFITEEAAEKIQEELAVITLADVEELGEEARKDSIYGWTFGAIEIGFNAEILS